LELVAFQAVPPIEKEGLPYWIFWFMLLIIMLLVVFIFLRDKSLRQRISTFLAGAKRRSILIRLKFQMKKERQKRIASLKRLGEKAWAEDIPHEESEAIRAELRGLFEKRGAFQMEWDAALRELEKLHKKLEETIGFYRKKVEEELLKRKPDDELLKRKKEEEKALKKVPHKDLEIERQIQEVKAEQAMIRDHINEVNAAVGEIESEGRGKRREVEKEIHHWEKKKEKIQDRIKEIEAHQEELFFALGRVFDDRRIDHPSLAVLYHEIDDIDHRISTLQHRIETLSGG